jgi:hypothetical protein
MLAEFLQRGKEGGIGEIIKAKFNSNNLEMCLYNNYSLIKTSSNTDARRQM